MGKKVNVVILEPYLVKKVWGGKRLSKLKGLVEKGDPLGESWEVSRLTEGESLANGNGLKGLVAEKELPYLVKFIDTEDNLSVQVHPDNDYAQKHENSNGKSECWIILEADKGAGIYLGFKEGVEKATFEKATLQGEDVSSFLNFIPVERGNFVYVPAGSIHAIGKGVLLAEVQQSSGVTYRVWDWNRLDVNGSYRDLHIKQALDVLNFDKQDNRREVFNFQKNVLNDRESNIFNHHDFSVFSYVLNEGEEVSLEATPLRKRSIICLSGELVTDNVCLRSYQSALLLTNKELVVKAKDKSEFIVIR